MGGRVREAWATISSAPWRRAPGLVRHRPGVMAAMAGACAVVAAAVASVPLFVSSVGSASVAVQVAERCPRDTGATLHVDPTPERLIDRGVDPFATLGDRLGPSTRWARRESVPMASPGSEVVTFVSVLMRDDALAHVDRLTGGGGPGVWLPDAAPDLDGFAVGDRALVDGVEVPVAGIYDDLRGASVDDFWCAHADLLLLEDRGGDLVLPPPVLLADAETFARLQHGTDAATAQGAWEAPLRPGTTVSEVAAMVPILACDEPESSALVWCAEGRPRLGQTRQYSRTIGDLVARDADDFVERYLGSHLPFVVRRAQSTQTSVAGGVWPIAGLAAIAGLGLVAAATSLWFDRRRRELRLLAVRGVSPAGLGVKAVLELVGPGTAGAVIGLVVAGIGVRAVGPSSGLERTAVIRAGLSAVGAVALAAAAMWAVATSRARAGERRARRRLGAVPWELGLLWLTTESYQRLGEWGVPVRRGAAVTHVDVWGLLFPVLFLLTAVAVASRMLYLGVRPIRLLSRSWPVALYLGVRRLTRYRVAVLGLVAASAIAAGVVGYATTMERSLAATLDAKARTFVGSDTAVRLARGEDLPAELVAQASTVQVFPDAWVDESSGRRSASLIAIDASTFAGSAFWDDTFAEEPLDALLDRLRRRPAPGRGASAVVVGGEVGVTAEVVVGAGGADRFEVDRIPGVEAFPGMRKPELTVFVEVSSIAHLALPGGHEETWIGGDRARTLATLDRLGTRYAEPRQHGAVVDGAAFRTVTWTFGFLQTLGVAAGLLALGGVAVYLDARRRDRALGHAFMRRMGLPRTTHRRAIAVELAGSALVGCWLGLGVALAAATVAHHRIDPVPGYQPAPVLRPAIGMSTAVAVGALLAVAVGAVAAQRRAERDDPIEVLRGGV